MDSNSLSYKRISVFVGHYGSGKTNVALNFALMLREKEENVAVADLDIVNPYFRTQDCAKMLEAKGIRLISSEFAGSNVDLPALPADVYTISDNRNVFAVMDVGGDDRGALALGRYVPAIVQEDNYNVFFVINKFRPLTKTPELTMEVLREVEQASGIKITALINNSNLGEITTAEDVEGSAQYASEVSRLSGITVAFTTVREDLCDRVNIENIMPIKLYVQQSWQKEV
ncbi:MAG: hypothetical protein IJ300_07860 [Clostridia bacterium]|nr:hypothetical protein [Clostridia bacterium]